MKKILFFTITLIACFSQADTIDLFKSTSCGCCKLWGDIMEDEGYQVDTFHPQDLDAVKSKWGVPPVLKSCHTAVIDGYVFEGHVPEADIRKFLDNPPDGMIGLSVPGMPALSPGMAPEGAEYENFNVVAFDKDGNMMLFNKY